MACNGYTKVWDLASGELVELDGARGTTLRVTRGTLWITHERDIRDIMLSAGDVYTIERGGLTLVEALADATVCVMAHYVDAVRLGGRRPTFVERAREWLRSTGAAAAHRRWVPHG